MKQFQTPITLYTKVPTQETWEDKNLLVHNCTNPRQHCSHFDIFHSGIVCFCFYHCHILYTISYPIDPVYYNTNKTSKGWVMHGNRLRRWRGPVSHAYNLISALFIYTTCYLIPPIIPWLKGCFPHFTDGEMEVRCPGPVDSKACGGVNHHTPDLLNILDGSSLSFKTPVCDAGSWPLFISSNSWGLSLCQAYAWNWAWYRM